MKTCDGQAQHLLNGLQVLGFEKLPVGHVAAELHSHGFAVDVGIGFVARVAVRNARKNDDQVLSVKSSAVRPVMRVPLTFRVRLSM